jgi:hypothetical protein
VLGAKIVRQLAEVAELRDRAERVSEDTRSLIQEYHQILSLFRSNGRSSARIPTPPVGISSRGANGARGGGFRTSR